MRCDVKEGTLGFCEAYGIQPRVKELTLQDYVWLVRLDQADTWSPRYTLSPTTVLPQAHSAVGTGPRHSGPKSFLEVLHSGSISMYMNILNNKVSPQWEN